eukprot:5561995-Pyramimonas_sp.AAC.1
MRLGDPSKGSRRATWPRARARARACGPVGARPRIALAKKPRPSDQGADNRSDDPPGPGRRRGPRDKRVYRAGHVRPRGLPRFPDGVQPGCPGRGAGNGY